MAKRMFFDDENIIGISTDIFNYFAGELGETLLDRNISQEDRARYTSITEKVLNDLLDYDDELVLCEYCAMDGSYIVYKYLLDKEVDK